MAGGVLGAGALLALLVVAIGDPVIRTLTRPMSRLSPSVGDRVAHLLGSFRASVVVLARRPQRALLLLALSAGIWGATIVGIRVIYAGTPFPGLGFRAAAVNWGLTLAAMTALPTPGFFGPYEAASSAALRLMGLAPEPAVAVAVVTHLGQFVFTVGLGLVFLLGAGLSLGELVRRSRRAGAGVGGP
jgi:uncharacterized membrane protein YbhN (UPF0104 family)